MRLYWSAGANRIDWKKASGNAILKRMLSDPSQMTHLGWSINMRFLM